MSLDLLPNDVIRLLLETLPIPSIGRFLQTQKSYRTLLNDRWWENYFFRHLSPDLRLLVSKIPITRQFLKEIGQYLLFLDPLRGQRLLKLYRLDLRSIYGSVDLDNGPNQVAFHSTRLGDGEPENSIELNIDIDQLNPQIICGRYLETLNDHGWITGKMIGDYLDFSLEMFFELARDIVLSGGKKYSSLPLTHVEEIRLIRWGETFETL